MQKTLVLTDGFWDHASSRTRAILYFNCFEESLELKISWIPRVPEHKKEYLYKWIIFPVFKRFLFIKQFITIISCSFKLVYIQRIFLNDWYLSILKKRNTIIIFDFDDAIYQNIYEINEINLSRTLMMLQSANQIIVSSSVLELFCKENGFDNVTVINTPVETERFLPFEKFRNREKIVIGWVGSPFTTRHLTTIQPALKSVCEKFGARLLLYGSQSDFKLEGIKIDYVPWSYDEEPDVLSTMDIGIMPLDFDIIYAKGKGGYKLFQYMAASLPVIASPIGINSEIVIQNQTGFLASTNEEWEKFLTFLIEHPEERERMGKNGRKLAEEKYSREYCSQLLVATIKPLLN